MQLDLSDITRVEAACRAISEVLDTAVFRSRFSNVRLLRSSNDIEAERQHLPPTLVPFMIERQPKSKDVYAFESREQIGGKVVVWNDHAVVFDWTSFEVFMKWLSGDPAAA